MFEFNEELFIKASRKIEDSALVLLSKKNVVKELNNLSFDCEFKSEINAIYDKMNEIINIVNELDINTANMKKTLINIDNSIFYEFGSGGLNSFLSKFLEGLSMSLNFLNSGQYGANQSGPILLLQKAELDYDSLTDIEKKQYQDLLKVLEKYGFLTKEGSWNKSMYSFMMDAENGGCGYAANTNIIIDIYSNMENGEEVFLKKYGFPLYYESENGEKIYNYDALFACHYLESMDSFSQQIIPGNDSLRIPSWWPKYNPSFLSNLLAGGSMNFQRTFALNNALSEIDFESTVVSSTNFEKLMQYSDEFGNHDYIIVEAHNFTLTSADGITESWDAGHFMLITGVNEDGKYIVSSWGKKYILENVGYGSLSFIDIGR